MSLLTRKKRNVLLLTMGLMVAGGALARPLTIVSWGGTYQDVQRKLFFTPFSQQSGVSLMDDSWDGGIGVLRTKTENGDSGWDIVQVESDELEAGCQEGMFVTLDYSKLGGKEAYIPGAAQPCGIGAAVYNFVLAWDTNAEKQAPRGWRDFFDITHFPGKRALRQGPKGNLEIALMADGVAPADVYAELSTPEGVARAFRKLDTIKPQLIFWKSGGQPMQMLASGEVAMTTSYNGRVTNAIEQDKKPFGLVWDQSLQTMDSWVILATSPNIKQAYQFLDFAGRPDVQKAWPALQPTGITSVAGIKAVAPEIAKSMPTAEANSKNVLRLNDAFWVNHYDELAAKWTAWSVK